MDEEGTGVAETDFAAAVADIEGMPLAERAEAYARLHEELSGRLDDEDDVASDA